jgi:hypothetical protein
MLVATDIFVYFDLPWASRQMKSADTEEHIIWKIMN